MKRTLIMISALAVLTAMFAVLHLSGRESDEKFTVLINGEKVNVSALSLSEVKGVIVNGKGGKSEICAEGISLNELFDRDLTVKAADSYTAEIGKDELDKAYLIKDGDMIRLVVFGDTDSKRNVKNVAEVWEND